MTLGGGGGKKARRGYHRGNNSVTVDKSNAFHRGPRGIGLETKTNWEGRSGHLNGEHPDDKVPTWSLTEGKERNKEGLSPKRSGKTSSRVKGINLGGKLGETPKNHEGGEIKSAVTLNCIVVNIPCQKLKKNCSLEQSTIKQLLYPKRGGDQDSRWKIPVSNKKPRQINNY